MADGDVTRTLAIVGAIAGAVGAVTGIVSMLWTIYRDVRDKGLLKIEMMVGRVRSAAGDAIRLAMTPEGPVPINLSDRDRIFITITNVGRRPITVNQCMGFQGARLGINRFGFRRQAFIIVPTDLPKKLDPGEQVMQWMDDPRAIETVRVLYVYDSTGKAWRVSRRLLQYVKRRVGKPEKPVSATPADGGNAQFDEAWRAERTASALKAGRELFGEEVRQ